MKYVFTFLLCFGFLITSNTYAQEETKKVVVIKKVKDADGKTTTERREATGDEADALLKKMKEDGSLDGIDIDIEVEKASKKSVQKKIRIEKSTESGDEKTMYKIVTEENGKKKVMEWNGDGEMPEEMKKYMEDRDVNVWVQKEEGDEKHVEITIEDDGEKKVMFWDGTGEMPAEMKKHMKDEDTNVWVQKEKGDEKHIKIIIEEDGEEKVMLWDGTGEMPAEMEKHIQTIDIKKTDDGDEMTITIKTDDDVHSEVHESHKMEKRMKKSSPNKVSLGIMIEDDTQGVVVSEVVDDSVAQKSGLKKGDTIIKVNDTYVFNTDMLLKALSKFDKGDTAKVTYLRNGKEKKIKAKF